MAVKSATKCVWCSQDFGDEPEQVQRHCQNPSCDWCATCHAEKSRQRRGR